MNNYNEDLGSLMPSLASTRNTEPLARPGSNVGAFYPTVANFKVTQVYKNSRILRGRFQPVGLTGRWVGLSLPARLHPIGLRAGVRLVEPKARRKGRPGSLSL